MATTTKPTLDASITGVTVTNHELLKLAYDSYLAAGRSVGATTKQRGEVRGGGKKPWKQKGTGRARFGSSRNPIWRGGGIVFGPRGNENYTKRLSTTSKRQAIRQALTLSEQAGKIHVLDVTTTGKTKDIVAFLADNKLDRRVLLVVDAKTPELLRSTSNVQAVKLLSAKYLNVYHLLNADNVVLTPAAVPIVNEWLATAQKEGDK
ncbi:MAG TPA: 50S ribosomal protein L4 [Candidatus Saccharimonadales bacterium]|jgi:large subunit ribosomal protein L4